MNAAEDKSACLFSLKLDYDPVACSFRESLCRKIPGLSTLNPRICESGRISSTELFMLQKRDVRIRSSLIPDFIMTKKKLKHILNDIYLTE